MKLSEKLIETFVISQEITCYLSSDFEVRPIYLQIMKFAMIAQR